MESLFNTIIVGAKCDTEAAKWTVKTADGSVTTCTYLVMATGSII